MSIEKGKTAKATMEILDVIIDNELDAEEAILALSCVLKATAVAIGGATEKEEEENEKENEESIH
jgi:hypothetical protein